MNILGGMGSVLKVAHTLIGYSTIKIFRFKQNVEDPQNAGELKPVYFEPPVIATASVQPVPRTLIAELGYDLQKDYIAVYTGEELTVRDLERGRAADAIDFNGHRWNVESNTNWVDQNGWRGSLCCDIGPVPT